MPSGRIEGDSDDLQAVTVIVPMRNAASTISETLEGLANQVYPLSFEVLVVDNGSTDSSVDIVRSFQSRIPGLQLTVATKRAGAAHARNAGAGEAQGEVLAFCDADDIPHRDWLRSIVRATSGTGAVGGRLVALQDDALSRVGVQSDGLPGLMNYLPWSTSANLAVPKVAFDEIGGFDEELAVCEDVDFSWRLQQAGYALSYCQEAVVRYRSRPSDLADARRCFAYAQGDVLVYKRHAQLGARRRSLPGAARAWLNLVISSPRVLSKTSRPKLLNSVARNLGWLVGSIKYRTFYP